MHSFVKVFAHVGAEVRDERSFDSHLGERVHVVACVYGFVRVVGLGEACVVDGLALVLDVELGAEKIVERFAEAESVHFHANTTHLHPLLQTADGAVDGREGVEVRLVLESNLVDEKVVVEPNAYLGHVHVVGQVLSRR